jgi:hypothetical protein
MSDFTPVVLVKGDVEFIATSPTSLVNALYGSGFARKPVPPAAAAEPAPADSETPPATEKATPTKSARKTAPDREGVDA